MLFILMVERYSCNIIAAPILVWALVVERLVLRSLSFAWNQSYADADVYV